MDHSPPYLRLEILNSRRENGHVDICFNQFCSSWNTNALTSCVAREPSVRIWYRVGIMHDSSNEIWMCKMTPTANGFSVNDGELSIEVAISPHGLIFTSASNDHAQCTGDVMLLIPSPKRQEFGNTVQLFSRNRTRLSIIHKRISVPGPGLADFQDCPEIERPLRKIRPTGIWIKPEGIGIIHRFQRLADNGDRDIFGKCKKRLEELADNNPRFTDLIPLILYEESFLDLHENRNEDGRRRIEQAVEISRKNHSANHCFMQAKMKYVQSALARRDGDYVKAKELLDHSAEILLPCAAGEETAENRYVMAAFYAEKSAKVGICRREEEIAEKCFGDVPKHLDAETRPITNRFLIRSKNRQIAFWVKSSRHLKKLDVDMHVPEENMAKACRMIAEVEQNLLEFYPKKPRMSFDIVKADYFIRRGNFERGMDPSMEALMIARERGWQEYVDVATQRVELISGRIEYRAARHH